MDYFEKEIAILNAMPECEGIYRKHKEKILKAFDAIKKLKEDSVPSKIEEGLYLGSFGAARNKAGLKSLNVTHILTVARKLPPAYPTEFEYKIIEVTDAKQTDLEQYFPECFDFIDEAIAKGGAVLVHCLAGVSRSVTVVLAYLMKKHHVSVIQAFEQVKRLRPQAYPNEGFLLQLWNYQGTLGGIEYTTTIDLWIREISLRKDCIST